MGYVLAGIFILATLCLPWIVYFRFGTLRDEVEDIRRDLKILQDKLSFLDRRAHIHEPQCESKRAHFYAPVVEEAIECQDAEPGDMPAFKQEAVRSSVTEPMFGFVKETSRRSFELNIGTKLPVWIGAISLICAVFFLVKYSIETGWMSPLVRLALGAMFGASLVLAGQWIARHIGIANSKRIAQGLVGAGLVSLYVSLYAAVNLYYFLPPLIGFGCMTVVTALAVVLSLRHGQAIAAFGLVGGLLTPALVSSPEPNAMALFAYLFLLFGGTLFILVRKGWWILAAMALIGVFLWTGFWYCVAFTPGDGFTVVFFAVAICAAVLAATRTHMLENQMTAAKTLSVHGLNIMALSGSALTIIWLSVQVPLSLFDWSMLGVLSLGCTGLAYFRPDIYERTLWAKLAADLVLFFMWVDNAPIANGLAVTAGMVIVYVGMPYFIMRRVDDPRFWAGTQLVASVFLYAISCYQMDLPEGIADHGLWGVIALFLAGLSVHQAREMRLKYKADDTIQDHLTAIYALAATSFISLGLFVETPQEYLPLAFALQTTATMWLYSRTGIDSLKKIALILTAVFIAVNYEQLFLFGELVLGSVIGGVPSRHLVENAMLDMPLLELGLPFLFMGLALLIQRRQENAENGLSHVLLGATLMLALASGYYAIREWFQEDPDFFAIRAGFLERGAVTLMLVVSGLAIMSYASRTGANFMKIWGRSLFHLAMLRIFWFDLLIFNPYLNSSQFVGDMPLLNGVTLTYGTGAALSLYALCTQTWGRDATFIKKAYQLLGFTTLLALFSLTVRQYFHGGRLVADVGMGHAEFYSYSIVWMLVGLGLLAFGIVRQNRTARLASLSFMLLTIGKVFLFDAAELEGLYRVFSFLGLGLSLIGLSYFYTRFIGRNGDEERKDTGASCF